MGQVGIPGMSGLMCKIGLNSEMVNLCAQAAAMAGECEPDWVGGYAPSWGCTGFVLTALGCSLSFSWKQRRWIWS